MTADCGNNASWNFRINPLRPPDSTPGAGPDTAHSNTEIETETQKKAVPKIPDYCWYLDPIIPDALPTRNSLSYRVI
jgi:hypothetical protein